MKMLLVAEESSVVEHFLACARPWDWSSALKKANEAILSGFCSNTQRMVFLVYSVILSFNSTVIDPGDFLTK